MTVTRDHERIVARGVVRNTGSRDGATSSRCTPSVRAARIPPRLVGFTRVEIPAGGETEFQIESSTDRLATRDPIAHAWRAASGPHRITVARHAGDPESATTDLDL